ncbi:MAG: M23 family metallopeptidase, partial [Flavobacteriaceae bacterium]|nr:M23 family metallopeptidase [Flavobacteriaceae bacterium]
KAALPVEKTVAMFTDQISAMAGKIDTMVFSKTRQTAHIYKTTFEKIVLDVVISLDSENNINGLFLQPHKPDNIPVLERNTTKMILPFNEECYVFWGGTSVDKNYHVAYDNQKYAYDIMMVKDGVSHKGDPKVNDNYYVFGKDIIAPCDAQVVQVITGVKDNIPGEMNPAQLTGNTVVLKTANNEFLLFAHLQEKSVVVTEGQEVKQGDLLGKCGNSGNTTEPHLHLSLQNVQDMGIATGGKLYFDRIMVNGEIKEDYLPEKNDKVKNIKS